MILAYLLCNYQKICKIFKKSFIIAVTTDGCSTMKKFGRLIPTLHQLCYAHGLQLVIHDVFYQKGTVCPMKISDYSSETMNLKMMKQ